MSKRGKIFAALTAVPLICAQIVLGSAVCFAQEPDTQAGSDGYCVISTSAVPEEGGSTKGGGVFRQGDTVTLTATPSDGWKFLYWEKQSQSSSGQSQYGSLAEKFMQPLAEINDVFQWSSGTQASSGTSQSDRVYSAQCVLRAEKNVSYAAYFEKDGAAASPQTSTSKQEASSSQNERATAPPPASGIGTVGANDAASVQRNIALRYVAEAGGTISGAADQQILSGADGQSVTAKPNDGYKFVSWSDGLKTPARQDLKVEESRTLTALFESTAPAQNTALADTSTPQPGTGDDFPRAMLFVIALLGVCLSVFFLHRYQCAKAGG